MAPSLMDTRSRPHAPTLRLVVAAGLALTLVGCGSADASATDEKAADSSSGPPDPISGKVRGFDYANAVVKICDHADYEQEYPLEDGFAAVEDELADDAGLYLKEGPVFTDADGDGSDEAAIVTMWLGPTGSDYYLQFFDWNADTERVEQVCPVVDLPSGGAIRDLGAADDGFDATFDHGPAGGGEFTEAVRLGLSGTDPVEISPGFGAAGRCDPTRPDGSEFGPAFARTAPDDIPIRVAPRDDAEQAGTTTDYSAITSIGGTAEEPRAVDGWVEVSLVRHDGIRVCGFIPADDLS